MFKILRNILIFGLVFLAPAVSMAQSATIPVDTSSKEEVVKPTLAEKKQKILTDFKLNISKMNLYVARTQTTVDRLGEKGIDLDEVENHLTSTSKSLIDAKVNLEKLVKVKISEENPEKSEAELKSSTKKVDDNIKEAKGHLIEALLKLKEKVSESLQSTEESI